MKTVNIHQAKTNLSKLINDVLNGEEVYIAKGNRPIVKLIVIDSKKEREIGRFKDCIKMSDDFNDELEDFKDYME